MVSKNVRRRWSPLCSSPLSSRVSAKFAHIRFYVSRCTDTNGRESKSSTETRRKSTPRSPFPLGALRPRKKALHRRTDICDAIATVIIIVGWRAPLHCALQCVARLRPARRRAVRAPQRQPCAR